MKIFIVDTVGVKAGMKEYNEELCIGLKKYCDVNILSNYNSDYSRNIFPAQFISGPLSLLKYKSSIKKCVSLILREKPDAVIVHVFNADNSLAELIRKINKHTKVISVIHDPESLIGKVYSGLKYILDSSFSIIVHNAFTKGELKKLFPDYEKKIRIISHPSFLNTVHFSERETKPGTFNILFFGLIKSSKGLDVLLKAFDELNDAFHLTIAGRLRMGNTDLSEMIYSNRNKSRMSLKTEFISPEERDILFKKNDVIVLPYKKVYQSGLALMAMSYGIHVIASDAEGILESISHGVNGLLFENGNYRSLADQLNIIYSDKELQLKLAKNALSYLKTNHDPGEIAKQFYEICCE